MCSSWSLWENNKFLIDRYLFKVSYGNTMCEIFWKWQRYQTDVVDDNAVLVSLLWTLNRFDTFWDFHVDFEQGNAVLFVGYLCFNMIFLNVGSILLDGFICLWIDSSFWIKNLGKLPKNYNPDVDPDPERWLPRWERSTFKHKKQKRGANTVGKILQIVQHALERLKK